MRYREFLRSRLKELIPSDIPLPSGFHLVGHVALLHADSRMQPYMELLGEATLQYDSRITSVAVRVGATSGVMRVPDYAVVAGESQTTTTHIEKGVQFRLDPTRITFSGGNKAERLHMGSVVKSGERVLDMFACVGQFALHMAKNRQTRVQAIELNPDAYQFLVSNVRLNGFEDTVEAVLGDLVDVIVVVSELGRAEAELLDLRPGWLGRGIFEVRLEGVLELRHGQKLVVEDQLLDRRQRVPHVGDADVAEHRSAIVDRPTVPHAATSLHAVAHQR